MERRFPVLLFLLVLLPGLQARADDDPAREPAAPVAVNAAKPAVECRYRIAEDFVPLTFSERLANATKSALGPPAFLGAAVRAAVFDADKRNQEAGSFGLRYGHAFAEETAGQALQAGIALARHEDNRYFASGRSGFGRRLAYAAASTVLARHDDGSRSVSLSALGGTAGMVAVSQAWQPRGTANAGNAAVSFGLSFGTRLLVNVVREFAPRLSAVLP